MNSGKTRQPRTWPTMVVGLCVAWLAGPGVAVGEAPSTCSATYAVTRAPSADAPALLGWRYLSHRDWSAELETANACIEARGGALDHGARAELHLASRDFARADVDATRRIAMADSAGAYYDRARIRAAAGRHAEAVMDFQQALRRERTDAGVIHMHLSIVLSAAGRHDEAITQARAAVSADVLEANRVLAQAFRLQGNLAGEIEAWTQHLARFRYDGDAYAARSVARSHLEQYADALTDAARAEDAPDAAAARALALRGLGRHAEAAAIYVAMATTYPDNPVGSHGLCFALTPLNRPAEALDQCDRAIALHATGEHGTPAAAYRGRGDALVALGRTPEAAQAYRASADMPGASRLTVQRAEAALARLAASTTD